VGCLLIVPNLLENLDKGKAKRVLIKSLLKLIPSTKGVGVKLALDLIHEVYPYGPSYIRYS